MKTIPESKLELYLKLGRTLAQFVKTDVYFESRTFDWVRLEKEKNVYSASLIRSFDEGDEFCIEVSTFKTVAALDEFERSAYKGSKEDVFAWMYSEFQIDRNAFHDIKGLHEKYLELVRANVLGSQLNE